jgi:hypothetical protein
MMHLGLCASRDRGIAATVKTFAQKLHSQASEAALNISHVWACMGMHGHADVRGPHGTFRVGAPVGTAQPSDVSFKRTVLIDART